MSRLLGIFSVTVVLSAALVAAAATGAFSASRDGAANVGRPTAVPGARPGTNTENMSPDEVRDLALDALKQKRDSGELPREEGQLPSEEAPAFLQGPDLAEKKAEEPAPAVIAASPEEEAALAAPSEDPSAAEGEEAPKQGMSKERIKEIAKEKARNDPYKVTGPKISTDPFTGTTIINTSPYAP